MRLPSSRWGRRALLAALAVLVLCVEPALAGPTTTADYIDGLHYRLLIIAIPVTIATEAALYYAVTNFRDNDEPSPTRENRTLEVTWTLATAIILVFVGAASYGVMAYPSVSYAGDLSAADSDDVVVQATAEQWGWTFDYTHHSNVSTSKVVALPVDTQAYIGVSSKDVVHSFGVPDMGLKQDAFPGEQNVVMTRTTEQGTYQGYCMEFCGVGHSNMNFRVEVMSQEEYQGWLGEQEQAPGNQQT